MRGLLRCAGTGEHEVGGPGGRFQGRNEAGHGRAGSEDRRELGGAVRDGRKAWHSGL